MQTMVYTLNLIFMMWTMSWILQLKIRPCGWWTSRHNLCFILKIHKNNTNKMIMNIIKKIHFEIGNQVWLHRQHIKTTWPFEKLDYERLGPFIINKQINIVAFLFKFINSMKIHGLCFVFPRWNHTIIHNLSKSFHTTSTNWNQQWTRVWSKRNDQL